MHTDRRTRIVVLGIASSLLGCNAIKDAIDDHTDLTRVSGRVSDNHGDPVADATIQIFDLLDNKDFVEGSDVQSGQAYIAKDKILASDNARDSGHTDADGTFEITNIAPGAFLGLATKDGCTASFAGFDEDTGILSVDTLIKPNFDNGLDFDVPEFIVACATPPEVGPDGNSDDAPPFDPPPPVLTCNMETCAAAGGTCQDDACAITCSAAACADSGGSCVDGTCVLPACNATACESAGGSCNGDACETPTCDDAMCSGAGGTCSGDGTTCDIAACIAAEADCTAAGGSCSADGSTCDLPLCSSDADCSAGQPGSYCTDPGDVALAACHPPDPGEITPPEMVVGWTGFRVTDSSDNVLADAAMGDQTIAGASVPADGIVRIYGDYSGDATLAYLQVQSGGQTCANNPPHTDFITVELANGGLSTSQGSFVELAVLGYEKIQLSTAAALGEGDRSYTVAIGEPCAPPEHPFTAILSWDAGPGEPADLDINVWNNAGELVFVGNKQAMWGQLALEGKGPGPEIFVADDVSQGPYTVKVEFFSGKPRDLEAKLRILRTVGGQATDESFTFVVSHPKDIAEIGVFTAE